MSKIVFFSIPAHGHTNPTLAVVRELISRGHQVWYYSYEEFREKIEALGAAFISCEQYESQAPQGARDPEKLTKDLSVSMQVLADTTLALCEPISRELLQLQPDCIVADSMAIWGKALALKLKIPYVCSTTTFAFNRYSAAVMKQSFGETLKMLLTMPRANRQIKRLYRAGYPFRSAMDIMQSDDGTETIVYTSPAFQPCSDTFSSHIAFVGPSIRPITEVPEVGELPLVYISLGTVLNDSAGFYRSCLEALRDMPCQAILSVGNQVDRKALEPVPDNCTVLPSVDQIGVLSRASVFLTHCGMNSVNEALYYGVPLVTFPQTTEQLGIARRTEELNAGLRLADTRPQTIRCALETVLQTGSYRETAGKLAESFRSCPGAAGAADRIEAMCRR